MGSNREGEGLWPVHSPAVSSSDLSARPALSDFLRLIILSWLTINASESSFICKVEENEYSGNARKFFSNTVNGEKKKSISHPEVIWLSDARPCQCSTQTTFKHTVAVSCSFAQCVCFFFQLLYWGNREKLRSCEINNNNSKSKNHISIFCGVWAANVHSFGWHSRQLQH